VSTLATIRSQTTRGGSHLGDVVWWGLADARVARSHLESVWAAARLDLASLPEPNSAEKALKTAVKESSVGLAGRLIRLGKEDEYEIVFAVVQEKRHQDGSVTYQQETRILLNRDTETLRSDVPGHDVAKAIELRFSELRHTHTADDIRRAVLKVLDSCAAVTLREHGGVYWVPSTYADQLRRLQSAVEQIGSSRAYLLPIHASAEATRTLGEAAKTSIEEELATLKNEVEGFLQAPPDRQSTLVRRLAAFRDLKARAELYRQILNVTVADLDLTVDNLTASVEQLLGHKARAAA
jgi:hypothetical protein